MPHSLNPIVQRLENCIDQIRQIQDILVTPSITFGVVHQGQVILKQSIGHRDVGNNLPADDDTIYMIGSCSKMFTSAAVGILVDEGKLSWTDPVQKYLPDFNPIGDPRIGKEADIIDILRHSTGIRAPNLLCIGPGPTPVSDGEDLVPLLNIMPTSDEKGQRFNREWWYNNAVYGLAVLIVERISGQQFADFVREHILMPLGMHRTLLKRTDIEKADNVAVPYTTLSNGAITSLSEKSWPSDNNSPLLGGNGIRSSLGDMLIWCTAVLDAERAEDEPAYQPQVPNNPLKQMNRVRRGYWTRPADDPEFSKDTAYCMGWFRARLPSSMLGAFSGNQHSREKEHQTHLQHILGRDQAGRPIQMIGHTGGMVGSVFSVFTFPDTQSAVVTMTNGRDLGDASDFAAQILIQALFDMTPKVDLTAWAKKEAELAKVHYRKQFKQPWEQNRKPDDPERDDLMLYVGQYRGFDNRFTLSVVPLSERSGESFQLSLIFNHRKATECPLAFYKRDVYSFFQQDEDTWKMMRPMVSDYKQMLLEFRFDESNESVKGLWWQWDEDAERAWMEKVAT
ncbi:serine hydrolase domain-containing protein [Aspergillus stella-maris]|uniref:serine hydrolase domain-containing protein n=1 Tax=Aspergillus stella-maris TaxID=1810926 RepID=UPI003CCDF7F2